MSQKETTLPLWGEAEFQRYLVELKPQAGRYPLIWALLRMRARQNGWFPGKLHTLLKRLMRRPYFLGETSDGIRFLGSTQQYYPAFCVTFPDSETHLCHLIVEQLRGREGVYLDVGTNIGIVATGVAREWKGTLFAFEPVWETARCAAATFALNDVTNIRLLPCAVGDTDGDISFFVPGGHAESASARRNLFPLEWQETRVPCRTVDSMRRENLLPQVALIKFDVEGYEPQAMQGATETIAGDRPAILYECHPEIAPQLGWKAEDIAGQIGACGSYTFRTLHRDGHLSAFPPESADVVDILATPN